MTDIYFSFDTEDFTCDRSSDAIREQANILREYGVRGNFNIVGYLARELVKCRRIDVLDALKDHTVTYHSLRHTYHPTIVEYTDIEDFDEAYRIASLEAAEGCGMVKAATGVDHFVSGMTPGDNYSYVAMYVYSDLGMPIFNGAFHCLPGYPGVHMCNAYQISYFPKELEILFFEPDYSVDALLDELAGNRQMVLCNHPNMVDHRFFWDKYNYDGANLYPMGEWVEPPRRTDEEIALYYARLRELIERLQADDRFRICDYDTLARRVAAEEEKRVVTREMLPAITENLARELVWMNAPVSLSVADCFYAARHFMDSDEPYRPGKVHGFLDQPQGITQPTTLSAATVRAMAAQSDPERFLPPCFTADGVTVGPADLMTAMLAVAQGAESVTLAPQPQQVNLDHLPWIRDIGFKGRWLFSPSLEDNYCGDRLRLQAWTARVEE